VCNAEVRARLDKLDNDLRREADVFLLESGIGRIISDAGFVAVGSYAMRTMAWRDLDFERMVESPSWSDQWTLGQALAETGCVWRLCCVDAYRQSSGDKGLYWGLRANYPDGGPTWKLDLWTARPAEFAYGLERRATWNSLMTEEARLHILAIKEAVYSRPEYRKNLLSVHIYEAVLERQITGLDAFLEWWRNGRL
jgi:hypothetical protein